MTVKRIDLLEYSVTDLTEHKIVTKGEAWGGFGPDPYPDKAWDDPVLLIVQQAKFQLDGKTNVPLAAGEMIVSANLPHAPWLVTESKMHFGPMGNGCEFRAVWYPPVPKQS